MRRNRHAAIAAVLAALSGAWLWAPPGQAMNTMPMNLSDLVRESDQIVVGSISVVDQGLGTNRLPYTEVQVKVSESILGTSGTTLKFRQFGLQSPLPAAAGRRYVGLVAGMPRYEVGEQVVLFLGKPSSIGYRTTIGLGQGKFALRGGNLENEVSNAGLFQNLSLGSRHLDDKEKHLVTTTQGAVDAKTFLGFLRRAVNETRWNQPIRKAPPLGGTLKGSVTIGGGPAHD